MTGSGAAHHLSGGLDRRGFFGRLESITTRELLLWVAALFCAARMADVIAAPVSSGTNRASWSVLELIVWGCATQLLWRDTRRAPASAGQLVVILGLLAVSVPLSGSARFAGMLAVGAAITWGRGWSPHERRFGFILMAIGLYRVASRLFVVLFADVILRLDTAVAGAMLEALVPGSSWTGNTIRPPDDVGITVGMACSSFANLWLVSLCYTSMAVLDGGRFSRRNLLAVSGIWAVIIIINTVRLVLMARSLDAYEYWHNGVGSDIFGVTLSLVTVVLCSWGSRWANFRG